MPSLRSFALNIEPLQQYRDFRLVWAGQVVNNMGTQVTQIALPYELYVLTNSALALGALAAVQLAAVLLFSPAAGAIADAIDRRKLLIMTNSGLLGASAMLAALAITGAVRPWHLFVLAFARAVLQAFNRPAQQAIIPRLVRLEDLTPAIALNQVGGKMASVIGPGVGGVVIATAGVGSAYAIDAATFLAGVVSMALIAPILPLGQPGKRGWAAIIEGLQYVRRVPIVLAAFAIDIDAMVFGLPVALFPILALHQFHAGPQGLGFLTAAPAAGAVVGGLSSGWMQRVRRPGRVVIAAVGVWGVAITLFGLTPSLPVALIFLAFAGGADSISAIMRWTIIQLSAPDRLRGRVTSFNSMVVNAGPRLGDIEATGVATLTNAQVSVVSGGLLALAGLAFVVKYFPQLSSYETGAEVEFGPESAAAGPLVAAAEA